MRAFRWALKRCVRAAFEITLSLATYFSRDLYWCAEAASLAHPQLKADLWNALAMYVGMLSVESAETEHASTSSDTEATLAAEGCSPSGDPDPHVSGGEALKADSAAGDLALRLADRIDDVFTEQMLQPERDWLVQHPASSSFSGAASGLKLLKSPLEVLEQGWGLLKQLIPQWSEASDAAAAAVKASDSISDAAHNATGGVAESRQYSGTTPLVGCSPPPVATTIAGELSGYKWHEEGQRRTASHLIRRQLLSGTATDTLGQPGHGQHLCTELAANEHVVVLRGAASHWPAIGRWNLDFVRRSSFQGKVRVASSLQFPFCEPMLAE